MKSTTIFCAAASYAVASHTFFTAVPSYAGSQAPGYCFALFFFFYLCSCLIIMFGKGKEYLGSRSVAVGCFLTAFIACANFLMPQIVSNQFSCYTAASLIGVLQARLWPRFMTEISARATSEKELAKKLGHFNLSWALPMCLSPYATSKVIESFSAEVALYIVSSGILLTGILQLSKPVKKCLQAKEFYIKNDFDLPLRQMAGLSLLILGIGVVLFKTHINVVLTENLQRPLKDFGLIISAVNSGIFLSFVVMERIDYWRWSRTAVLVMQSLTLIACLTVFSGNFLLIIIGAFLSGISHGFLYGAHQFYCSETSSNKIAAMARHETVLSIGVVAGSILGGRTDWPFEIHYLTAIGAIVLTYFIQLWFFRKPAQV